MDPLSEVLSLLKLKSYVSGGFIIDAKSGFEIPKYLGVKCYAPVFGSCWLIVDGVTDPMRIKEGECVILPHGLPFRLTAEPALPRVKFRRLTVRAVGDEQLYDGTRACSLIGGHFFLAGNHAETLLKCLPSVVHLRKQADNATIRWSLERLIQESRNPQPGGSLIAQQCAHLMLVQALRLHLREESARGVGWLFALAHPQMRIAMSCMHGDPAHPWTIQKLADRVGLSRTAFAQTFKKIVGTPSMEYLTGWRMSLAAARLKSSGDPVSAISSSVGYETESAFGKAFRRTWGCSPSEHRRASLANVTAHS